MSIKPNTSRFRNLMPLEREINISEHNIKIPDLIDQTKTLEHQARQAFELRKENIKTARSMMLDRKEAEHLTLHEPVGTFEDLVKYKKEKYGLTGDKLFLDIIRSSQTTRKSINKSLGLE